MVLGVEESPAQEKEGARQKWESETGPDEVLLRAKAGNPIFLYRLGTYAEGGISHEENGIDAALNLYQAAARKGHGPAMLRLSELYGWGLGVEQDNAKSRDWRQKALQTEK